MYMSLAVGYCTILFWNKVPWGAREEEQLYASFDILSAKLLTCLNIRQLLLYILENQHVFITTANPQFLHIVNSWTFRRRLWADFTPSGGASLHPVASLNAKLSLPCSILMLNRQMSIISNTWTTNVSAPISQNVTQTLQNVDFAHGITNSTLTLLSQSITQHPGRYLSFSLNYPPTPYIAQIFCRTWVKKLYLK